MSAARACSPTSRAAMQTAQARARHTDSHTAPRREHRPGVRAAANSTPTSRAPRSFERTPRAGGRARELPYGSGPPLELGASIIHGSNQIVLGLALAANLTAAPVDDSGSGAMGLWDGGGFVLRLVGAAAAVHCCWLCVSY